MTTLRSIPCGRLGFDGSSPLAIRSVQSAIIFNMCSSPSAEAEETICPPACPDCNLRSHASVELLNFPSEGWNSRVPLLPSWWQARQVPDLMLRIKSACTLTLGEIPLPFGPVPGNFVLSGTFKSENQYPAG